MAPAKTTKKPSAPQKKTKEENDKKKKKPFDEIDEIFQLKVSKKQEEAPRKGEKLELNPKSKKNIKKKKREKAKWLPGVGDGADNRTRRRRTADGLAIYSAEELGFDNPDAGSTPLCPFDCTCCH